MLGRVRSRMRGRSTLEPCPNQPRTAFHVQQTVRLANDARPTNHRRRLSQPSHHLYGVTERSRLRTAHLRLRERWMEREAPLAARDGGLGHDAPLPTEAVVTDHD